MYNGKHTGGTDYSPAPAPRMSTTRASNTNDQFVSAHVANGPIPSNLVELSAVIDALQEEISYMQDRLGPVLGLEAPAMAAPGAEASPAGQSDFARYVAEQTGRVRNAIHRLADLRSRVEV